VEQGEKEEMESGEMKEEELEVVGEKISVVTRGRNSVADEESDGVKGRSE
jgi:hypothetical protein